MVNLLQETLATLERKGKTPNDVLWVGDGYKKTTWNNFEKISNFDYDNGYGCNVISSYLLIVGDGWWLERGEYDGSEWWEYKQLPNCVAVEDSNLLSVVDNWELDGLEWEK